MQQALEKAAYRADYLPESAPLTPPKRTCLSNGRKPIFQKLRDLYVEECGKEPESVQELRTNVNLLEKLVMQENLSCLVVNIYSGNEPYSLMLIGENGSESETIHLPYEEKEFLEYLDAEELPPILIDLLAKSRANVFYSGCVVAEIRDYKQCRKMHSPGYQSKHVLLRPAVQISSCDHSATSDNHTWAQEDRHVLESLLLLASADPSTAVDCTANRLRCDKQKMNSHPVEKCFKGYSRSSVNQPLEVSDCPPVLQLRSFTSCHQNEERKAAHQHDLTISAAENCVDVWEQSLRDLAMPPEVDIEKYAETENSDIPDDSQPAVWEAWNVNDNLLDCEDGNWSHKRMLRVMLSCNDPLLSETIQPCEKDNDSEVSPFHFFIDDHKDWYIPGTDAVAEKVIGQYQGLVQKECLVSAPQSSSGSATWCLSLRKERKRPLRVLIQSSALRKKAKRPTPPLKLPSSSGSDSRVSCSSLQQADSFLKSPTTSSVSKPLVPSQKSPLNLNQVSTLSPAALSPASLTRRNTTAMVVVKYNRVNRSKAVSSVPRTQASRSGSDPELSSSPGTKTPAEVNSSSRLPSGGVQPTAGSRATQSASQSNVVLVIKNNSAVNPLIVQHIPSHQLILVQQQQQQQLVPFALQQMPQQPEPCTQQAREQGSAQGSTSQEQALLTQPTVVINFGVLPCLVSCRSGALPQLASSQVSPERSLPH